MVEHISPRVKRALLSVSDKTGLVEFCQRLAAVGVELYSTGGTSAALAAAGLKVHDIADYTGFPEMMDGRVKTLHPKVHGGILCRHDHASDLQSMADHGIVSFELVVVNLYPFESTIARAGVTDAEAIEQIDIGGPSLIRGAAKNHAFVTVVTSADDYQAVAEQVEACGATTYQLRRALAGKAYARTAEYDATIAGYFARTEAAAEPFPGRLHLSFARQEVLRYGENPHQQAALFAEPAPPAGTLVTAEKLNGKELSYNNLLDLDSGLAIVRLLRRPAVSVIKHNNPCGAAEADDLADATRRALDGDPVSAFGSVLAFNRPVDAASAEVLIEPNRFIEAICAPDFTPEAIELLTTRPKWKANVRLMRLGPLPETAVGWDYRRIAGGLLVQTADTLADPADDWSVVTRAVPTDAQWRDLKFAWNVVRHVKSNAIVLAADTTLVGVGAGQMSRVDSTQIAIGKAGLQSTGTVLASDAFFPFADSIQAAAAAGVRAVIQPGGSRNDDQVVEACNQHGLAMVLTGRRHFKH